MRNDFYNCAKHEDMVRLANRVYDVHPDLRPSCAALVMACGLMHTPWYIKIGMWALQMRHRETRASSWLRLMRKYGQRRTTSLENNILYALQVHIVNGKDLNPPPGTVSAGGLNQREVNMLVDILNHLDSYLYGLHLSGR